MKRATTGRDEITNVAGERVRAFVPKPLPPKPALQFDGKLQIVTESLAPDQGLQQLCACTTR
ncbi:MAG: hypothetical protein ACXW5U_08955 [Thermoanaerobaculia bacterium]